MRAGLIGLVLATTLLGGAASARDIPAGGLTLAELNAWMQSKGHAPEVVPDKDGTSHLRTVIGGVKCGLYLFDCIGGRCGSIQFSAGWTANGKFDVSKMNQWNRDKRWCRGYFDATNDPWVELDIDLTPGDSYELLDDEFKVYQLCVRDFSAMYGL
jgi:hypothetical protein